MKPIASEALETLSAVIQEKTPTKSTEKSSAAAKRTGIHIVDITDQFVGKSMIITGAKKPLEK